jgi:hypothetical protein
MSRKRKVNGRFAALRAKSPVYWVAFVAWFSLVGYVAWLSFIHALANVTWQQNPDMALRFVPDHPLALSRKADELFAEKQDEATLVRVEAMAKQSLRGGALNPVAIRLLGYVADARGDQKRARELMLMSHKVSRRDFGTQLWLIEDAVARNDKKQALYHYDIALRTTPNSHSLLLPTLIGALDDPEVRVALVPYIKNTPGWLPAFLDTALATIENPVNLADILLKAGELPDRLEYKGYSNALLAKLGAEGDFPAFRQFYLSLRGSDPSTLERAAMTRATVNLRHPVAGWQLAENASIGGTFSQPDAKGNISLSAFAGTGERGGLTRKYLYLKPGSYQFSAQYEAQESAADSEIRWELLCFNGKQSSSKWVASTSVVKGRTSETTEFALGSDCPVQLLQLHIAGGSEQLGAEFTLRSVDITRR